MVVVTWPVVGSVIHRRQVPSAARSRAMLAGMGPRRTCAGSLVRARRVAEGDDDADVGSGGDWDWPGPGVGGSVGGAAGAGAGAGGGAPAGSSWCWGRWGCWRGC